MPLDVAASERKDRHKLQLAALDVVERGGDQPGSDATSSGELLVDECVVAMPVGVVDDAEVAPLAVTIQAHCDPSLLPKHHATSCTVADREGDRDQCRRVSR